MNREQHGPGRLGGLRAAGGRLLRAAVDLVLPPRCLRCGDAVLGADELCALCWREVRFIEPPLCDVCGYPLPRPLPGRAICGACAAERPRFDRARASVAYDDGSRDLILAFKHGDRIENVGLFARWMCRSAADLLAAADVIVPVPLHRWRLLKRGFNQSALLARAVSRRSGVAWLPDTLVRQRATRSQQGLGAAARRANVTGAAFAVEPGGRPLVEGRRVLLIDDVLTTGATLGACTAVLRRHGAAGVDVLTLARVVKTDLLLI